MRKLINRQSGYTVLEIIIVTVSVMILLALVFFFSD